MTRYRLPFHSSIPLTDPSFLAGFARAIDIFGMLDRKVSTDRSVERDRAALDDDWRRVASDFWTVLGRAR